MPSSAKTQVGLAQLATETAPAKRAIGSIFASNDRLLLRRHQSAGAGYPPTCSESLKAKRCQSQIS